MVCTAMDERIQERKAIMNRDALIERFGKELGLYSYQIELLKQMDKLPRGLKIAYGRHGNIYAFKGGTHEPTNHISNP